MTESELAVKLVEDVANNPLSSIRVYWSIGDWSLKGELNCSVGIIFVEFDLDVCHLYKGFDEFGVDFQPFPKPFSMGVVGKFPSIIERAIQPLKEYLKNL